jgi:hypothetical protein
MRGGGHKRDDCAAEIRALDNAHDNFADVIADSQAARKWAGSNDRPCVSPGGSAFCTGRNRKENLP